MTDTNSTEKRKLLKKAAKTLFFYCLDCATVDIRSFKIHV